MIRIRRISNPYLEVNIRKLEKVKEIIKVQIPLLSSEKIDEIENQMVDTLKYNYQTILFIAEDIDESVKGFAILLHMPDLQYCYLDFLAVAPGKAPSGLGGALYGRVREEADALEAFGVFFECLPDDPELCLDKGLIVQNQKRLAFYERFGARPIVNTLYETTVDEDEDSPPYLVFDGLGIRNSIPKERACEIVKSILVRKYSDYCPESYIEKVVNSIQNDPVTMRAPRYTRTKNNSIVKEHRNKKDKLLLIVNDKHFIHHIRERGYVESPVRVETIRKELDKTGMFRYGQVNEYPDKLILNVHDKKYFNYFKKVCENLPKGKSVYPYVFPLRNAANAPKELAVRAGYYCFDTFTPLNKNAFLAARWGVNCTLTATDELIAASCRAAYVLTRPPGHHAEKSVFGGFCYFNNCAIAANRLSKLGKVAILDIDYHHGNGQQQIFYSRNDVLTISIHGHPSIAYPYFSGFAKEKGEEMGLGFNANFPLPEKITYETYSTILNKALKLILNFKTDYLIVALGLDTAKGDPTGTWDFTFENFLNTGKLIGGLKIPTLIVQEGGYRNQSLGSNARAFFNGFYHSNSKKVKTE